jgi:hypothetical protein
VITLVLAAKAGLAVLLLAAGGAKLADLDGFGDAIAMFLPRRVPVAIGGRTEVAAVAVALTEVAAGALSLCWPGLGWANLVVLALACVFAAVAAIGYAMHRGRPWRCFGALTRREFGARTLAQAVLMVCAAVLAARPVAPADLSFGLIERLLLLTAAGMLALAAGTAARALGGDAAAPGFAA